MSNLTDRVSYLKGLAEGLKLNAESNEGKLIEKMLDVLSDLAAEVEDLRADHDDLNEYVESIDSDLSDMEDMLFGEEDEDGCGCGGHCHCHEDEDEDDEEDDESLVEYTCPHCGEEMTFEVENFDFDEDYLCPNCHQPLFPETPDEE
ncbi:MAG: zinc ribbon domain-containing protein [Clostridiales bacterium]|nr:zinc ribbon domain-containing protein [Clostridiales bacterium]